LTAHFKSAVIVRKKITIQGWSVIKTTPLVKCATFYKNLKGHLLHTYHDVKKSKSSKKSSVTRFSFEFDICSTIWKELSISCFSVLICSKLFCNEIYYDQYWPSLEIFGKCDVKAKLVNDKVNIGKFFHIWVSCTLRLYPWSLLLHWTLHCSAKEKLLKQSTKCCKNKTCFAVCISF